MRAPVVIIALSAMGTVGSWYWYSHQPKLVVKPPLERATGPGGNLITGNEYVCTDVSVDGKTMGHCEGAVNHIYQYSDYTAIMPDNSKAHISNVGGGVHVDFPSGSVFVTSEGTLINIDKAVVWIPRPQGAK